MFEGVLDPVLGPMMNLPDPYGLLVISALITLLITLIYKYATDQEKMKELKDSIKDSQKKMKEMKDQPDKMMAMQKESMQKNMTYMKHSMKPTLYTFLPIIFIFGWLRDHYVNLGNPDVFFGLSWIWAYLIFSMALSIILRKALKIY